MVDLLDEASKRFVNPLHQDCPPPQKLARTHIRRTASSHQNRPAPQHKGVGQGSDKDEAAYKNTEMGKKRDFDDLTDILIANRCGTHSLGLIYEFFFKMTGDPEAARRDFDTFLSGEWSHRWVEEAVSKVAKEQPSWDGAASKVLSVPPESEGTELLPLVLPALLDASQSAKA
jgi:hypothetical protein